MKIYLALLKYPNPEIPVEQQYVTAENILAATIKLIKELDSPDIEILSVAFISNTL